MELPSLRHEANRNVLGVIIFSIVTGVETRCRGVSSSKDREAMSVFT